MCDKNHTCDKTEKPTFPNYKTFEVGGEFLNIEVADESLSAV